jgi:hypothetical protein
LSFDLSSMVCGEGRRDCLEVERMAGRAAGSEFIEGYGVGLVFRKSEDDLIWLFQWCLSSQN